MKDEKSLQARDGNNQAQAEWIDTYSPLVKRFAYQLGNSLEMSEVITEEVMIVLFRYVDFLSQVNVENWLFKITLKVSADFSKQPEGRFKKRMTLRKKRAAEVIFTAEEDQIVHDYIQRLDEKERLAIVLYYLHERSYEEIADISGFSNANATAHLSFGKEKLMKWIASKNESYLYDELLLEHTLEKLNKVYEKIPGVEDRSKILAAIKKGQKGANKRGNLTYALSLIGIGMLSGAFLMQAVDDTMAGSSKQTSELAAAKSDALTPVDVKATFDSLEELHAKKVEAAREKLGLPKDQADKLAPYIEIDLKGLKMTYLKQIAGFDHDDLKQTKKEYQMMIENAFTVPADTIDALIEKKSKQDDNMMPEYELLNQLDMYQYVYQETNFLSDWRSMKGLEHESLLSLVNKLNASGKDISNKQVKAFATGVKNNGYQFVVKDEVILVKIDYRGVIRKLGSHVGKDYILYIDFRSKKFFDDHGNITSYRDLGEFLVKSERDLAVIESRQIKEMMRNELQSYYAAFVNNMGPSRIFDEHNILREEVRSAYEQIISNHPESKTAESIQLVYEELAAASFEKPVDFDNRQVLFPSYLNF